MTVTVICCALLLIGLFFNGLGVAGILRFPDVYTRLHAETKATTFGSIFTSLSVIVYAIGHGTGGQDLVLVLHVVLAVAILAFSNATGAHAIARAAYRSGIKPSPALVDQLEGVED